MLKNAIWLFTFALLTLIFFLPSYTQMQDLKHRNAEYERQIQELTRKNVKLREERRLLKDDPEYFEKVGRERMGLVRENEVIYKFVPADQASKPAAANAQKSAAPAANAQKSAAPAAAKPAPTTNVTPRTTTAPAAQPKP